MMNVRFAPTFNVNLHNDSETKRSDFLRMFR